MATSKDPIRLRQRKRDSGRISLYLDIYVKGRRKCETLNLYLEPGDSREIKEYNRQQLALAETIRAQRLIDLRNRRYNLNDEGVASPYIIDYFYSVMTRKSPNLSERTFFVWRNTYNYIRDYTYSNVPRGNQRWANTTQPYDRRRATEKKGDTPRIPNYRGDKAISCHGVCGCRY